MAEVVQTTQQEFWRPPSPLIGDGETVISSISTMAEACARCGTEFLSGSHFCHSCGVRRPEAMSAATKADAAALAHIWEQTRSGGDARPLQPLEPNPIPIVAALSAFSRDQESGRPLDRVPDRLCPWFGMCRRSPFGWTSQRQDTDRLAGNSVLPRRVAARSDRCLCRRNSAKETGFRRQRRLARFASRPRSPPLLIHPVEMVDGTVPLPIACPFEIAAVT